jgi:hypothetical protein
VVAGWWGYTSGSVRTMDNDMSPLVYSGNTVSPVAEQGVTMKCSRSWDLPVYGA